MLAFITGLDPEDFRSCVGGITEEDVHKSREAKKRWPLHTECKNTKTPAITGWLRQAEEDAPVGEPPAVVFKLHGSSKPYIVLSLFDFFDLLYGPLTLEQMEALETLAQKGKTK